VYRTPAVGPPAPDYLNAAVAFRAVLPVDDIKARLVSIENAAGRSRARPRGAVCELDLDLLLYGRRVDARQRLPHPDVLVRAHVLAPLADIAADLVHPLTGQRIADAWAASARGAGIVNVGPLDST
jgi:2-amino-4-hydroxy-6-hydroxymethyldihydropteridine diphosphokinase